jgi:signal transduction histidine kinase
MGERVRALDWSRTPVGPVDQWPQSLRSAVSMLLPSKAQILLFWGPEFVCIYNDAYRPVFGAKHPQMLGRPGREAWSEIWDSMLHDLLAGVVRTGEAFWAKDLMFELERHGFVEETYFDVSYDPVRVESGLVGGVFCIVTETTERVIGERRLALLKDLAARNAPARTVREACLLTTDTLAGNAADIPFALVYLGDELECATPDAERRLADTPRSLIRELPIHASGSGSRPARLVVGLNPRRPFDEHYQSFLELVAGQLATALGNARAHEEERQRAEALADIDRAKTAFFSNVSHEFRTPLTLLMGPVEDTLAEPTLPEGVRGRLELAHRNSLRLLKLVNTLLDFSRIEAGRVAAAYEPTDLPRLTTELASTFRSTIERAGMSLGVDCPPLPEAVYVDREMWEKIVLNLLSNAFKFTFEGRIDVSLRADGDVVRLHVSDTGTGIAAEEVGRLFERFHRVKGARGRSYEGSGIGLALVQELARLHGGSVSVTSELGAGSTFTVTIPRGTHHLPAERIAAATAREGSSLYADAFVQEAGRWLHEDSPSPDLPDEFTTDSVARLVGAGPTRQGRILVADDNADMRAYLMRILGERYDVDAVADGRAALEKLRRSTPDLVLTDVMMPSLDGFGVLAAIRNDERLRSLPVVLLSARAGEESRIEGLDAGADEYMVKPFSARELLACVASQLKLSRVRQETNRLKDDFLASLSHELRTPLNAILGYVRMLRRGALTPDRHDKALDTIERNATSLAQIVEDVLDVSRIVSGKIRLNITSVDLAWIVHSALEVIVPMTEAKGVRVEANLGSHVPTLAGDPERLQQVLWNLLSNAAKFTEPGGTVRVSLARRDGDAEIVVSDTGIGIAPEFLPHVFERFRQGDAGTTRERGGLGLGLSIARQLVEMHGGTIHASSDGVGHGATFRVTLPLVTAD